MNHWDKPMAARGLTSYRYPGRYGWIMIGAKDDLDALREAQRSMSTGTPVIEKLQKWNGETYSNVLIATKNKD